MCPDCNASPAVTLAGFCEPCAQIADLIGGGEINRLKKLGLANKTPKACPAERKNTP